MADVTKAWHKVFDTGTKTAQKRLKKAHGHKPEFQAFLQSRGDEGGERSVKQATTSLTKATDAKIAAQKIADMRYKKALKVSSDRVREMGRRRRESGEGLGGGLETARDVVAHVKKYGSIKAGRLGEAMDRTQLIAKAAKDVEKKKAATKIVDRLKSTSYGRGAGLNPAKDLKLMPSSPLKTDMSALSIKRHSMNYEEVQIDEVTKKEAEAVIGGPTKEKPKMPPGKQPAGYRYVRSLARKAMKKGMKEEVEIVEEIKDQADVGEYDYEGDMAKSQLRSILANAKRMHDMLQENTNLPEWVQSKITLAQDYILTAASYMEAEMNEEFTDEELASLSEASMTDAQMKKREKFVKSMKPVSDWEKRYPGRGEQVMYATATKMAMKEEAEEVVEETTEQIEEKYMGFKALKASIAAKGNVRDPAAVAAAIGRKKYGKEKFQAMAAAGKKANEEVEQVEEGLAAKETAKKASELSDKFQKKNPEKSKVYRDIAIKATSRIKTGVGHSNQGSYRDIEGGGNKALRRQGISPAGKSPAFPFRNEEVVTEAEGKVAVTPKEKALAAHHGDKSKITYGDVIKARLKSAAAKAMKKGN